MSDHEEYSSEDDEDYKPSDEEVSSDYLNEHENAPTLKRKRDKNSGSDEDSCIDEESPAKNIKLQPKELSKEISNEIWSNFLKDVGGPSKYVNSTHEFKSVTKSANENITVTKVYNFAGEEVKITEILKPLPKETVREPLEDSSSSKSVDNSPKPTGLTNVLNKLSKPKTINTLLKSKLDWEKFKETEGISEELKHHNKGKDGYLEKQAFLERTDLREFEIEKNLRAVARKKQ